MDTKEQASQPALQTLKEYAVITAAVLIMDIGIYVFKFPNNFSFGGVSGMAVVICRFLPFTASQINLFINLLLLLVGFAVLGRNSALPLFFRHWRQHCCFLRMPPAAARTSSP